MMGLRRLSAIRTFFLIGGVVGLFLYLLSDYWLLPSSSNSLSSLIGVFDIPSQQQVVQRTTPYMLFWRRPGQSTTTPSSPSSTSIPPVNSLDINVLDTWKIKAWKKGDAVGLSPSDLPNVTVSTVSCRTLFKGNPVHIQKAKDFQASNPKEAISPESYTSKTNNCSDFVRDRRYALRPANDEEASFPLAFSILMFKDVEQFERLLRAIYRPQNFYCVHVDSKSPEAIHQAVQSISRCFGNIFVLTPPFSVSWGAYSVLEPELVCMKKLLKKSKKWKYFINLTGQEFPLKTNWQIVRILKVFNGSNNMEGTVERRNPERFADKTPPVNVTLTKGSVHIVAKRAFVEYVINNATAKNFLDWVKNTYIPDETFFSSLNHSPQLGVPGSYLDVMGNIIIACAIVQCTGKVVFSGKGKPETNTDTYRFITRFKNWGDGPFNWPCYGKRVSMVCIFAVGDLKLLASRPELFANKFYLDYEPLALDCMEELHYARLREDLEAGDRAEFDTSVYASQSFVRNHL